MKKIAKYLLISLILYAKLNAQYICGEIYPGYIIKNNGELVKGYLLYTNRLDHQSAAVFYKNRNDLSSRETFSPADIKMYEVGDLCFEAVKLKVPFFNKLVQKQFARRITGNYLNLYEVYSMDSSKVSDINELRKLPDDDGFLLGEWYLRKVHEEFACCYAKYIMGFSKKMSEYLSDCRELAGKIRNKEKGYGFTKAEEIVKEYNECLPEKQNESEDMEVFVKNETGSTSKLDQAIAELSEKMDVLADCDEIAEEISTLIGGQTTGFIYIKAIKILKARKKCKNI